MAPRKSKPPRRKPNTGTIRFKKGRDRPWEAAFPLDHGEYRYDSFQTRPEATAWLDQLATERDNTESPRNITGGSMLVKYLLPEWLATRIGHIAPKTHEGYAYLLELASGEIGNYRVDAVTRKTATDMLTYFATKIQFQNTPQLRSACLMAFEYAVEEDYIKKNPFAKAKAPPVERRQGLALTETQRARLLDCAATEDYPDEPLQPLWHLYSRLAFRRGEGMGLRRADCDLRDLDHATLMIVQQRQRVGHETVLRKTTKSKKPRPVPIPRDIADLLAAHLDAQVKRAARDPDYVLSGYVFVDAHGQPFTVDAIWKRWKQLRARATMPGGLRIHDLRHTALTILALAGVPDTVRMALAGHATVQQSIDYANHASVEDIRRAIQ